MKKPLTCRGCGLTFASATSLDEHRVGVFPHWRCLTEDEMIAQRMHKNEKGLWVVARNHFHIRCRR